MSDDTRFIAGVATKCNSGALTIVWFTFAAAMLAGDSPTVRALCLLGMFAGAALSFLWAGALQSGLDNEPEQEVVLGWVALLMQIVVAAIAMVTIALIVRGGS